MKVNITLSIDKKVYSEIKELKIFRNLSKFTNQIFRNYIEDYKKKQLIIACKKRASDQALLAEMEELALPVYANLEENFLRKKKVIQKSE